MQNKRKRLIPGCNGQFYVHVYGKTDWQEIFKWLNDKNYKNVHHYTEDLYPRHPDVVCINERDHCFGGTNITCMACAAQSGHKEVEFEEFKIRRSWNIFALTIDIQSDHVTFFCQNREMRSDEKLCDGCYRLHFDGKNKEKLFYALTRHTEVTEQNFIKAINGNFYCKQSGEDWFNIEKFENFCCDNHVEYAKSIESTQTIRDYYESHGRVQFV